MIGMAVGKRSVRATEATKKVDVKPPQYSPTPLQRSVRDSDHTIKSAVSVVKPPASEAVKALLPRSSTPASDGAKSRSRPRSPSPAASDSTELSSFVSKSPPFRPDYNDIQMADEYNSVDLLVTSISLLPEDCKAFLSEGDLTYKVLISGKVFRLSEVHASSGEKDVHPESGKPRSYHWCQVYTLSR